MGWKRYWTAWSRHHRSGGFGIHSPYAYQFVRHVWRQPQPYYAYEGIHQLIDTIKAGTTRSQRREMDLISEQEARLLFRVTNFFNPQHILQVGAATGVESISLLAVSRDSRLYIYAPQLEQNALAVRVLQSQLDRIQCYDDPAVALDDFTKQSSDDYASTIALINVPAGESVLKQLIDLKTVIVMRNLHNDTAMMTQFGICCDYMTKGQTYSNGKIAILLPNPKLQREDFALWL